MSDNTVEVKFGADVGQLKDGVKNASDAVEKSVQRMTSAFGNMASSMQGHTTQISGATNVMANSVTASFDRVGAAINAAMAPLIALMAILKGGEFFSKAIDETKQFTGETIKLSKTLGITVDEATALNLALGDIYVTTDTFIGATTALTRQLRTNEQGIKDMGVATRDSSGNLRPMNDILMDGVAVLKDYKEGTDRNLAAQKLFGRGAQDAIQLLKMNNDVLEEAKKKQAALGLTITQENVEALKKYKAAMNDAGDVMLAVKKVIADSIMPILTALGEWFASTGPSRVNFFSGVMKVLSTVLNVVATGFMQLMTVVNTVASTVINAGMAIYEFWKALKDGKGYEAAKQAAMDRFEAIKQDWTTAANDIINQGKQMQERISQAWNPKNTPADKPPSGTKTMAEEVKPAEKPKSRMSEFDLELADRKVAYAKANDLREMSKKEEFAYWDEVKAKYRLTKEEQIAIGRKQAELELGWMRDERNGLMARLEVELADRKTAYAKQNGLREMSKRDEIAYWEEVKNKHQLSKEEQLAISRKTAQLELEALREERSARIAKLVDDIEAYRYNSEKRIEAAKRAADEIGKTYGYDSRQYEDAQKKIVQVRRQAEDQIKALAEEQRATIREMDLSIIDAAQQQAELEVQLGRKTNKELLALEEQFEVERNRIKMTALADRKAQIEAMGDDKDPVALAKVNKEIQALEIQHQSAISAIRAKAAVEQNKYSSEFFSGMSSGFNSVLSSFLKGTMSIRDMFKGMVSAILDAFTNMLAKFAVDWLTNQIMQRVGSKMTALSAIMSNAAVAGSAAFASTAAIPVIGPELAPAAAATAYAGASSFAASIPAAAQGYDIPAGINPLTQLHEKEMVLPASQADVIRNMAENGGGNAPINVNISALDARSVRDLFMREGAALSASIRNQTRTFGLSSMNIKGAR